MKAPGLRHAAIRFHSCHSSGTPVEAKEPSVRRPHALRKLPTAAPLATAPARSPAPLDTRKLHEMASSEAKLILRVSSVAQVPVAGCRDGSVFAHTRSRHELKQPLPLLLQYFGALPRAVGKAAKSTTTAGAAAAAAAPAATVAPVRAAAAVATAAARESALSSR